MVVGHHLAGLVLSLAAGCHGGAPASGDPPSVASETGSTVIPGALVGPSWPVLMADDAARATFEQHPGWAALVMQRDYPVALAAFSAEPALPAGQARVHAELSAAYRQAALVAAQATVQVWSVERRDEDPPEVGCLVGLSQLILADAAAIASLEACTSNVDGPLAAAAAAWLEWKQSGAAWPPVAPFAATPGRPAAAMAGGMPDAGPLPQYLLHDLVEHREIQAASPMTLLGLALYHEDAAVLALGGDATIPAVLLAPWRLPLEPTSTLAAGSLAAEQLFGSPLLVSDDAWFLAELTHGQGLSAVTTWRERSALAAAIGPCVAVAARKVDPACAVERAARAFEQVRGAMEIKCGGEQGYHRPFAEMARLGVVRAAEMAAAAAGDEKPMGLLRLSGIDLSLGSAAEPHYLLSIAAWDAHNKNSSRAAETLHAQVGHIPGAEVARFPLDALHVRLSRESAPGVPMN